MSINVEELISKVHRHPELWDPTSAGYSDKLCKDSAWDDIVRSMYPEYEEAEQKVMKKNIKISWRSTRDKFRQEITHEDTPSDSASPPKRPHLYLEQLMFLKPYLELHNCESDVTPPAAEEPDQGQESNEGVSILATQEDSPVSQEGRNSLVSQQTATSSAVPKAAASHPTQARKARHKIRRLTSGTDTGDELDFRVASFITRSTREDHADAFCRTLSTFIRRVNDDLKARLECAILALVDACISPCIPIELLDYVMRWQLEHPPGPRTSATSSSQTEQGIGSCPSSGPSLDLSTGLGPSPSDVARTDAGQSQNWYSGHACSSEVHTYSAPTMQYSGHVNPSQTRQMEGMSWPAANSRSFQNTNQRNAEFSFSQQTYPIYPNPTLGAQQYMAHYSSHHSDPYPTHFTTSATHSPPLYTRGRQSYDSSTRGQSSTSYSSSQPNTTLSYLSSLLDLSSEGHRTPTQLFQSSTPTATHRAITQLSQPSSCVVSSPILDIVNSNEMSTRP